MSRGNGEIMKLNLCRLEVCDIMLALLLVSQNSDAEKWNVLHDKEKAQLYDFDKKC